MDEDKKRKNHKEGKKAGTGLGVKQAKIKEGGKPEKDRSSEFFGRGEIF